MSSNSQLAPAIIAWGLFLSTSAVFFVVICPLLVQISLVLPILCSINFIFVFINFLLSTFTDPGKYSRARPDEYLDDDFHTPLYKNTEISGVSYRMKWCSTCQFYRPPRCSHCSVCNYCIEMFDHHCPWVNNCIGRRNYRFFYQFLLGLCIYVVIVFTCCLIYVLNNNQNLLTFPNIVGISLMTIAGLLCIPIFGLTIFHLSLVGQGKTTNEQVTGKLKYFSNPFSRSCTGNCLWAICSSRWPNAKRQQKRVPHRNLQKAQVLYQVSQNEVKISLLEKVNGSLTTDGTIRLANSDIGDRDSYHSQSHPYSVSGDNDRGLLIDPPRSPTMPRRTQTPRLIQDPRSPTPTDPRIQTPASSERYRPSPYGPSSDPRSPISSLSRPLHNEIILHQPHQHHAEPSAPSTSMHQRAYYLPNTAPAGDTPAPKQPLLEMAKLSDFSPSKRPLSFVQAVAMADQLENGDDQSKMMSGKRARGAQGDSSKLVHNSKQNESSMVASQASLYDVGEEISV